MLQWTWDTCFTAALLLLYCWFTTALLLLYTTRALLALAPQTQEIFIFIFQLTGGQREHYGGCCFTAALLLLY